jgi:hypothetical protein
MVNAKKKQRLNQGITEEMFTKLHQKPLLYKRGNSPDSHTRSLCFVLEGSCDVINQAEKWYVYYHNVGAGVQRVVQVHEADARSRYMALADVEAKILYHGKVIEQSGLPKSLELCLTQAVKEDSSTLFELTHGNHFGTSDLLRIVDTEYLGDIIAGE